MKKLIISGVLLFFLVTSLAAFDFTDVLEKNIGKEVIIFLDKKVIQLGGASALYPLYIDSIINDILILKSKGCEIVVYIDIEKITAVEIINLL